MGVPAQLAAVHKYANTNSLTIAQVPGRGVRCAEIDSRRPRGRHHDSNSRKDGSVGPRVGGPGKNPRPSEGPRHDPGFRRGARPLLILRTQASLAVLGEARKNLLTQQLVPGGPRFRHGLPARKSQRVKDVVGNRCRRGTVLERVERRPGRFHRARSFRRRSPFRLPDTWRRSFCYCATAGALRRTI